MIEGLRDVLELVFVVLTAAGLGRELRDSLRRYDAETASPTVYRESSGALLRPAGVSVALSAGLVLGFVVAFL